LTIAQQNLHFKIIIVNTTSDRLFVSAVNFDNSEETLKKAIEFVTKYPMIWQLQVGRSNSQEMKILKARGFVGRELITDQNSPAAHTLSALFCKST
jgi:hypothetical protein